MPADLVVDASGHGRLTEAILNSMGWPLPEATSIGVDMGYATAFFDIPKNAPPEWMGVFTLPGYPRNKRGAFMLPVEDNRWILTILGGYDQKPPADWDDFRTAWGRAKMGAHSKHACLLGLFHSNIPLLAEQGSERACSGQGRAVVWRGTANPSRLKRSERIGHMEGRADSTAATTMSGFLKKFQQSVMRHNTGSEQSSIPYSSLAHKSRVGGTPTGLLQVCQAQK